MANQDEGIRALNLDEHSEDGHAKRVVPRYLNPDTGLWQNVVPDLVAGVDFDLLTVSNINSTSDSLALTLAASPVQTITLTYASSNVPKVSDSIASVGFA